MPQSPTARALKRRHARALASRQPAGIPPPSPTSPRRKRCQAMHTARAVSPPKITPRIAVHYPPLSRVQQNEHIKTSIFAFNCHLQCTRFIAKSIPLILDTGASIGITSTKSDFILPITPVQNTTLKGIASGLSIHGIGTVSYHILDDAKRPLKIIIPGVLYVPDSPCRLICPRQLLATSHDPTAFCSIHSDNIMLNLRGSHITVHYDAKTDLPILHTTPGPQSFLTFCRANNMSPSPQLHANTACHNATNTNLSPSQLVKLQWHQRLDHVNFDQLCSWMRNGSIRVSPAVINSPNPVCPACQYGKGHRRPHTSDDGKIGLNHTHSGHGVSADQLEAGCPGIVPTNKGSPTTSKYRYCNFWIDHFSRYIYVTMHQTKDAKEMLQSKREFELFSARYNVRIKSICADNGIYSSQTFKISCDQQSQHLTLCAVGSHWQNGIAERTIGVIQQSARNILLHAMTHWPSIISENFWPFAIRHAVNLYNTCNRGPASKSPFELFTNELPSRSLTDYKVFGCPVYVLCKELQDNPGSDRKWESRCWQGVYIGHSSLHAGNVALVYNPVTKHVTQQFHVIFDESFSSMMSNIPQQNDSSIERILSKTSWLYTDDFAPTTEHYTFPDKPDESHIRPAPPQALMAIDSNTAPSDAIIPPKPCYKPIKCSSNFQAWKLQENIAADVYYCCTPTSIDPSTSSSPVNSGTPPSIYYSTFEDTIDPPSTSSTYKGPHNIAAPHVYQAALSTNDTLTQSAMLKAPDTADFLAAQKPEIAGLEASGVFSYHSIDTLPPKARLLNIIWSYRRKRTPTASRDCALTDPNNNMASITGTLMHLLSPGAPSASF
jgi:hypothetical protein